MDYYLNDNHVTNRLITEWNTYKKVIIAYDFDDTIYDYHKRDFKYNDVINLLKEAKEIGAYFIVFTSCDEKQHDFIKEYLNKNNIPFDKINENMDFIPFSGRKIYYNILLDDRAGLRTAYNCLLEAVNYMKNM